MSVSREQVRGINSNAQTAANSSTSNAQTALGSLTNNAQALVQGAIGNPLLTAAIGQAVKAAGGYTQLARGVLDVVLAAALAPPPVGGPAGYADQHYLPLRETMDSILDCPAGSLC